MLAVRVLEEVNQGLATLVGLGLLVLGFEVEGDGDDLVLAGLDNLPHDLATVGQGAQLRVVHPLVLGSDADVVVYGIVKPPALGFWSGLGKRLSRSEEVLAVGTVELASDRRAQLLQLASDGLAHGAHQSWIVGNV